MKQFLLNLFFRAKFLAVNVAQEITDNIALIVGASNARALSGEEWEQITPWGMFPNPKGVQRITPAQGNAMVQAFNALKAEKGEGFRGLPVYIGHPDIDPKIYKDHGRIGKITDLATKADGLYCKVAWNDIGKKNQEEGYYVYPSGVWHFKKCAGGVIEPFELSSVGLTNVPNIGAVKPWAKNDQDKTGNAGTSAGALKGWETRRGRGIAGRKNNMAVKVRATMKAKKAGRKPTAQDLEAAGDALEKKTPGQKGAETKRMNASRAASAKQAIDNLHLAGASHAEAKRIDAKYAKGFDDASSAALRKRNPSPAEVEHVNDLATKSHDAGTDRVRAQYAHEHAQAVVDDMHADPRMRPHIEKAAQDRLNKAADDQDAARAAGDGTGLRAANRDRATAESTLTRMGRGFQGQPQTKKNLLAGKSIRIGDATLKHDESGTPRVIPPPPRIPAPPRSISSGRGTHVHVHVAPSGSASADNDPYFGYTGNSLSASIRRRVAMNAGQKQTAAA